MHPETEKAGPVAGTDLRITDLAIVTEISTSVLELQQARQITRRCGISMSIAYVLAPLVFGEGGAA
jgi:hypothetical protein